MRFGESAGREPPPCRCRFRNASSNVCGVTGVFRGHGRWRCLGRLWLEESGNGNDERNQGGGEGEFEDQTNRAVPLRWRRGRGSSWLHGPHKLEMRNG